MYLLKLLQCDASVFGQSLTLLSGLHSQLTGLGFQRSNFFLETTIWITNTEKLNPLIVHWKMKVNRTNIDFTLISQWFIFHRHFYLPFVWWRCCDTELCPEAAADWWSRVPPPNCSPSPTAETPGPQTAWSQLQESPLPMHTPSAGSTRSHFILSAIAVNMLCGSWS